jgi:hypothetical protein
VRSIDEAILIQIKRGLDSPSVGDSLRFTPLEYQVVPLLFVQGTERQRITEGSCGAVDILPLEIVEFGERMGSGQRRSHCTRGYSWKKENETSQDPS